MAKSLFEQLGGTLHSYLTDIDMQAQERFERFVEQMKQAAGSKLCCFSFGWYLYKAMYGKRQICLQLFCELSI